jgi:hypothetical protein
MKEPDPAGRAGQRLLREFEVSRIDVQADQGSIRAQVSRQRRRMSGPAEGAINQRLTRLDAQKLPNLFEENRQVTRGRQFQHDRKRQNSDLSLEFRLLRRIIVRRLLGLVLRDLRSDAGRAQRSDEPVTNSR